MLRELYYLNKIRRNVWLDKDEIERMQEKKLREVIKYAYENVSYYNRLFRQHKIKPEEIKTAEDLKKIPILDKLELRDNLKDFISGKVDKKKCKIKSTSGSTGRPLRIAEDRKTEAYGTALRYRSYMENGYKFRYKLAEFTHPRHFENKPLKFLNSLGILKKHRLSVFDSNEKHISTLNKIKPDIIEGYPSILKLIALENKKLPQPKKIFTTAETLLEKDRKAIKEKFNCDVIDFYGCTEIPRIAWECSSHEGYHIDADQTIVELIEDGRSGKRGQIVVTTLYNYCMPLIRYKVGDYGVMKDKPCSCGRGLPLMSSIEGRMDDFIVLPNGQKISPRSINVLDDIRGIADYKTIQKERNLFLVQLVKNKEFSEKTLGEIERQIKKGCLGMDVKISFEFLEKIENIGKRRTVISEVKS